MNRKNRIIRIYGDSILKGVVYRPEDDRYVSLQHHGFDRLASRLGMEFHNVSLFGCTITKGMQMLQRAVNKGLCCDGMLVEYGGNDCDFLWHEVSAAPHAEHLPKTPLDQFEQTLRDMLHLIRTHDVVPVLMTLPPIDSVRYLKHICRNGLDRDRILQFLGHVSMIERYQEMYSSNIATVALETQTQLIDVRSAFLRRNDYASLLCEDGIHPNARGHELIMNKLSALQHIDRAQIA